MEKKNDTEKLEKNTVLILLFISIICLFMGASLAVFSFLGQGNTNNVIQTGRIIFSYSDAEKAGNGINITDAIPIPDSSGKLLNGQGEYFDFSVSASTTNTDLSYEVVVLKDSESDIDDEWVKIYLTEFEGNDEKVVPLTSGTVPTYSILKDTTNKLLEGKTIYFGEVKAGEVAYGKKFRLRMWLSDSTGLNYDSILGKTYKVKVNVAAVGAN